MLQLAITLNGLCRLDARSIPQSGDSVGKFWRRIWNLGRRSMHRHGSLPTTLPLARASPRMQPTPAVASTDQLHHPVPSRLLCRWGSSSVRAGLPPSHPNCGVGSALKLVKNGALGAAMRCALHFEGGLQRDPCLRKRHSWNAAEPDAAAQGSAPPCRPRLEATHQTKRVHARGSLACARPTRPRTAVCPKPAIHILVLRGPNGMEKEKKLDSRCIVSLGFRLCSRGRQRTGNRASLGTDPTHREGPGDDVTPFLPRFLQQEVIIAHSPYDDLQENLLCRADWLCLRGIAATELAILPTRELAACPCCSACEHPSSGERPPARRSQPAPVLVDGFSWQPEQVPWSGSSGRADSPCSGRTNSIYDSEPDFWKWDLARNFCPHVHGPESQPAVPSQPRLLLRELIFAHSHPTDPRRSLRGSPLTKSDWLSLRRVAHRVCHHHGSGHCQLLMEAHSSQSAQRSHHPCPQHSGSVFSRSQPGVRMTGKRKRSGSDTQVASSSVNGPEVDSPWACVHKGSGPGGEERPFFSRFCIARNRALPVRRPPRLQGNGLASAARDCNIRMGDLSHCSACEHLGSGGAPHGAALAFGGLVPCYRSAGRVDGRADSTSKSEPVHREWDLGVAGGCCPSVSEPPLPLQPTVLFQPRFLLQEVIRAHCPFQPRLSAHGSHLTECDWLSLRSAARNRKRHHRSRRCQLLTAERQAVNPLSVVQNFRSLSTTLPFISLHAVWIPCSPAAFRFREQQQQSLFGGAGQVGGGHPGVRSTSAEAVDSGRFVGAQHERTRYHPQGSCGASRSRRHSTGPMTWSFGSGHPAAPTQPMMWRSETGPAVRVKSPPP